MEAQRLSVSFCLACEEVLRQCANHPTLRIQRELLHRKPRIFGRTGMTRLWTRISNHVGTHPAFVRGDDYDEECLTQTLMFHAVLLVSPKGQPVQP